MTDQPDTSNPAPNSADSLTTSRRKMIVASAVTAGAVMTLKGGVAWAGSAIHCTVGIPTTGGDKNPILNGQVIYLDKNGNIARKTFKGVPDGVVTYSGNQIRDSQQNKYYIPKTHVEYLKYVSDGQGGSCLGSIANTL